MSHLLTDFFCDNRSLATERKVVAKKKEVVVKTQEKFLPDFPAYVFIIIIGYLDPYARETMSLHRLVTEDRIVVNGDPKEFVNKRLIPRLTKWAAPNASPRTYSIFLRVFSFAEQYAMFVHDQPALFSALGMGRHKKAKAKLLTFVEFQDCLYLVVFGKTRTQLEKEMAAPQVKYMTSRDLPVSNGQKRLDAMIGKFMPPVQKTQVHQTLGQEIESQMMSSEPRRRGALSEQDVIMY